MSKGPYSMTTPCANCPFRSDVTPYIREDRVREIKDGLVRGEFPCHKTTVNAGDGERVSTDDSIHCAGALILMIKEDRSSQMMRISHRLGMFDPEKLDMGAPVYDSFDEMAEACAEQERQSRCSRKRKRAG
jgi:hypothetical protein